jgi:hypothetical protein
VAAMTITDMALMVTVVGVLAIPLGVDLAVVFGWMWRQWQ